MKNIRRETEQTLTLTQTKKFLAGPLKDNQRNAAATRR